MTTQRLEIKPVEDRIVIKPDKGEETHRGIVLPDNMRKKVQTGIVIAVGPGKYSEVTGKRLEHGIKPGDRAIYAEYAGAEIHLDGEEHFVLRAEEVLAVEPLD